jgi:metal-sulfur cluster biosynthetic enzyme
MKKLMEVIDPELGISIVDLGLIYAVEIKPAKIKLTMTLTTIGCPLFSLIEDDVRNKIKELGYKKSQIKIKLTFDPPWDADRMSESAKAMLGI